MTAWAWPVPGVVGMLIMTALGDLISEEIRGWLDLIPHAILRLAATRLDPAQRQAIYDDEWLPELCYALRGAESRPITRLIRGIKYASGLLRSAPRITRTHPAVAGTPAEITASLVVVTPPSADHIVPAWANVRLNLQQILADTNSRIRQAAMPFDRWPLPPDQNGSTHDG